MDPSDLRDRALAAYERRRLLDAVPWAIPGLLLALVTHWRGGTPLAWVFGGALAALAAGFAWRGQELGRALLPGFAAGSIGWGIPLAFGCLSGACSAMCTAQCLVLASVAGGLSGGLLWRRLGVTTTAGALGIAALSAAMGCLPMGTAGIFGVLALLLSLIHI